MELEFKGTLYVGGEVDDESTLASLPDELRSFYQDVNGIIAFQGGLHIRGCVVNPHWHSLGEAWHGNQALYKIFPVLRESDIPFAQDCLGDQFVLRLGTVWHLMAESGEIEDLELELFDFLEEAIKEPIDFLSLEPLLVFLEEDQILEPGYLLRPDPPFIVEAEKYKLHKVKIEERLSDF